MSDKTEKPYVITEQEARLAVANYLAGKHLTEWQRKIIDSACRKYINDFWGTEESDA